MSMLIFFLKFLIVLIVGDFIFLWFLEYKITQTTYESYSKQKLYKLYTNIIYGLREFI